MPAKKVKVVGWNHLREKYKGSGRLKMYRSYGEHNPFLGYFVEHSEILKEQDEAFSKAPVYTCPTLDKDVVVHDGVLIGELVEEKPKLPGHRYSGTLYEIKLLSEGDLRDIEADLKYENRITHLLSKDKVVI